MQGITKEIILIGGIYNICFVIFHLMFWRIFRWKKDLARLTALNRSVMQILNLCLTYVFIIMAYVSLFHTSELITTGLGQALLFAFSLFWFLRTIEQIVFFGLRKVKSIVFTLIFLLGSVIYLIPALTVVS